MQLNSLTRTTHPLARLADRNCGFAVAEPSK